jgi:hypothetical protein
MFVGAGTGKVKNYEIRLRKEKEEIVFGRLNFIPGKSCLTHF